MDNRGIEHAYFNHDGDLRDMGAALGHRLRQALDVVLLGRDDEFGSATLLEALAQGFSRAGIDVVDCGLLTSRHLAHDSELLETPAVMVHALPGTAFTLTVLPAGRPVSLDMIDLSQPAPTVATPGTRQDLDTLDDFVAELHAGRDLARLPALALHVDGDTAHQRLLHALLPGSVPADRTTCDLAVRVAGDDLLVASRQGGWRSLATEGPDPLEALLDHALALPVADWTPEVSDPRHAIKAVREAFGHHGLQRRDLHRADLREHRVVFTAPAGPRGSWSIVLDTEHGSHRLHVLVRASDDAVEQAVRDDLRAVIESAA